MPTATLTEEQFYTEFLMARQRFVPQDFGVEMGREQFNERCIDEFSNTYRTWTIDELLLHPTEASRFVSDVRRKYGWWDVPDDIILRVILANRKNP